MLFLRKRSKLPEGLAKLLDDLEAVYRVQKYYLQKHRIGNRHGWFSWEIWTPDDTISVSRFYDNATVQESMQGAIAYHHIEMGISYVYFPQIRILTRIKDGEVISSGEIKALTYKGGKRFLIELAEDEYIEQQEAKKFKNTLTLSHE